MGMYRDKQPGADAKPVSLGYTNDKRLKRIKDKIVCFRWCQKGYILDAPYYSLWYRYVFIMFSQCGHR